jgi:hypothetical protein
MIWVDTEAENEHGKPEMGRQRLTFGVAIYERYRNHHSHKPAERSRIRFKTPIEFWAWVMGLADDRSSLWVMAHNWNYDAGILDTSNILPGLGCELLKYINGKPPVIVKWKFNKDGRRFNIHMIDTLNYFRDSVKGLGDAVGLPKLDMPVNGTVQGWDDYAWRDVEIIKAAFLAFRKFVVKHDIGNLQPTLASQSMSAFRHRFMPIVPLVHDDDNSLELERAGFHGGRTEAFFRGNPHKKLYKLDINSQYPTIMATCRLGYQFESYFTTFKKSWWDAAIKDGKSIVARCIIKTDEPVYGIVHDSKLVFPVGEFETVLTTPEILYALKAGHIQSIGEFAIHKSAVLFKDFVDYFYGLRQEYKIAGNKTFDYMSKILMNSLYGKFGQNGRKWIENPDLYWPYETEGCIELPNGDIIKVRQRLGKVQELKTDSEAENSVPMISAEITAHGRVWLWNLIKLAGRGHTYYVDTDSLIVDSIGYKNLYELCDATRMGAIKLEGTAKKSVFYAPKDYVFGSETRIKGVRSKAEKLGPSTYRQELFHSWDSNLAKGKDGFINVAPVTKTLSRINTKRKVIGDNQWTFPILVAQNAVGTVSEK